ncbi:MAG TPA: ABC transporter ATP-binding protein [Nocardioides sp.]|nr:ABC transporter ATP-binding protein [Nocardioides sp.]
MNPAPIELTGGAVAAGGRLLISDVDLRVEDGDFIALMGPNGSGKSTLVRALTGLRPLAAGSLRLFGEPVDRFKDWPRLGYVPQRVNASSGIPTSVWEVVASGRLGRRGLFRPLSRADRRVIGSALETVGLSNRATDPVTDLSGGQQQRAYIARALAGEPDLFFLDEPTAGVDLPNQQVLADTLGMLKEQGRTIVLVAHELGPLAGLVDRTVVMRDGHKAYDGVPLADHDVHGPVFFGEEHSHHHHEVPERHDHPPTPQVASPLECDHE